MTWALLAASYLLGSVPASYIVAKVFHGIDLREHGSGNLGATNAFRVMGARSALPVVLFDVGKGVVPVLVFGSLAGAANGWRLAFGGAAIAGHMFSVWVRFRGGKGIATSAGVFVGLAPWAVLGALVVWLALTLPSGYVSLGSIGAAVVLPLLVAVTPHEGGAGLLWFSTGLAVFVIWLHRGNLRRLVRGEENRFGRREAPATERGPPGAGP